MSYHGRLPGAGREHQILKISTNHALSRDLFQPVMFYEYFVVVCWVHFLPNVAGDEVIAAGNGCVRLLITTVDKSRENRFSPLFLVVLVNWARVSRITVACIRKSVIDQ